MKKGEASRLIEALTALEMVDELAELAAIEHRLIEFKEDLAAVIEAKRADLDPAEFEKWLRRQGANLDRKLAAA